MEKLKSLLTYLFFLVIVYLFVAFVKLDLNLFDYQSEDRFMIVFFSLVFYSVYFIINFKPKQ